MKAFTLMLALLLTMLTAYTHAKQPPLTDVADHSVQEALMVDYSGNSGSRSINVINKAKHEGLFLKSTAKEENPATTERELDHSPTTDHQTHTTDGNGDGMPTEEDTNAPTSRTKQNAIGTESEQSPGNDIGKSNRANEGPETLVNGKPVAVSRAKIDRARSRTTTSQNRLGFLDYLKPCKLLKQQFNVSVSCKVDLAKLKSKRQLSWTVDYNKPLCSGPDFPACFRPSYSGSLDLKNKLINTSIAFKNMSIGGTGLGDLSVGLDICVNLKLNQNGRTLELKEPEAMVEVASSSNTLVKEHSVGGVSRQNERLATPFPTPAVSAGGSDSTPAPAPGIGNIITFCGCRVTYNGVACKSCKVCGRKRGVSFDCSNVASFLKVGKSCEKVTAITSLVGLGEKIQPQVPKFLLKLKQLLKP